jgi:hypothetical protein
MPAGPSNTATAPEPFAARTNRRVERVEQRRATDVARQGDRNARVGHVADEAIAAAAVGADPALGVPVVAERPARLLERAGERLRRHHRIGPQCAQHFGLRHHAAAVSDQEGEQIEDLRLEGNGSARAPQLAPFLAELEVAESQQSPAPARSPGGRAPKIMLRSSYRARSDLR